MINKEKLIEKLKKEIGDAPAFPTTNSSRRYSGMTYREYLISLSWNNCTNFARFNCTAFVDIILEQMAQDIINKTEQNKPIKTLSVMQKKRNEIHSNWEDK